MIILYLVLSAVAWLCVAGVFERLYQHMKPDYHGHLQKHQWCWIWWSTLGVLSFACTGPAGLVQMALIFCIAAGHIAVCGIREDCVTIAQIIHSIPGALRSVYERFRSI